MKFTKIGLQDFIRGYILDDNLIQQGSKAYYISDDFACTINKISLPEIKEAEIVGYSKELYKVVGYRIPNNSKHPFGGNYKVIPRGRVFSSKEEANRYVKEIISGWIESLENYKEEING